MTDAAPRVALVTGAARRIGATIAQRLHADGYAVLLHHNRSGDAALALAASLEQIRSNSAATLAADLLIGGDIARLAGDALARWGRLDLLVNNASVFRPSPLGASSPPLWDELIGSNLRAPFLLAEALAPALRASRGAIVNLVDLYAERPLADHAIYSAAKAGLVMLTRSLARDLAPSVRVNAVAPGAILWPEAGADEAAQAAILARVPLARMGSAEDIAAAVAFLAGAPYVTGQTLRVDGGRHMAG